MRKPQIYKAIISNKQPASSKVTKLWIKNINPQEINFIPGQFINLRCPNGHYRAYSITSDYKNKTELTILVETGHKGLASDYVNSMKIGDEIEYIGPSGVLSLYEPLPDHLVFFATGTGISPFLAMFTRLADLNYTGKIELYFGARLDAEVLELEQLESFKNKLPGFTYTVYVSQPIEGSKFPSGRITEEVLNMTDMTARYFACGHPVMVSEVKEELILNGVNEQNVITEGFTRSNN